MFRFFKLFIIFIFLIACIFSYNRSVEGFSVRQIRSTFLKEPAKEILSLNEEQMNFLQKELSHPLKYLGKGCQFYAFESHDQRYVIKFFKQKHLRQWDWILGLPLPNVVRSYFEKKNLISKIRKEKLFSSCQVGYELLSEETGIIFTHLNKTDHLNKEIILKNKIGFNQKIELDEIEFIVQKKGIPAKEFLPEVAHNNKEEIPQILDKIAFAILKRCQKGVIDGDKAFVQNVAFTSDQSEVLFIDIGQYEENSLIKSAENTQKELLNRFYSLMSWSQKSCPELIPYVEKKLKEISNSPLN